MHPCGSGCRTGSGSPGTCHAPSRTPPCVPVQYQMKRFVLPAVVVALALLDARLALACTTDADCVVEACDMVCDTGTCVPGVAAFGTECRPVADVCDVAEMCDGVSTTCPLDLFDDLGTICRGSAGACD